MFSLTPSLSFLSFHRLQESRWTWCLGAGSWGYKGKRRGGALFLGDLGAPLPFSPLPGCRGWGPSHVQAVAGGATGESAGSAAPGGSWLAPRVGFAQGESCQLCPFENEQQRGKERKEKGKWGSPGWESGGRPGLGEQVGTI